MIFLDIPLLFEVHLESLCDKIIVVYVDENTQAQRLMKRNHITIEEAHHLMSQQISIEKRKIWVIISSTTIKILKIYIKI